LQKPREVDEMEELTWGILLAAYLFVGGMAGGAYIIGALADLTGRKTKGWKILSKSGIYVSLFSIIIGLVLLILDLGRFEVAPHDRIAIDSDSMVLQGKQICTKAFRDGRTVARNLYCSLHRYTPNFR